MSTFTLEIALNNVGMQSGHDISEALRAAARRLEDGEDSGSIRDANGNTVGSWQIRGA